MRLKRPRWVWARNLCLAGMWLCYYAGLPFMIFSLAAACYYTAPVWMALLSRILLDERIGCVKLIAIFTAFVGVMIAVDPLGSELSLAVLLPLAAALFYALTAIITWSRCAEEAPLALAFNLNIILVIAGSVGTAMLVLFAPADADGFILSAWPSLGTAEWLLIVFLALLHPVIEMAVAKAYQLAPSTIIGVFDNAYLPFAAFWAFVLMFEIPTWSEASGMTLIAAAGILIVREGHRRSR
ncbi:DMT family transporter [Mesorhizobium sp. SB112]|uniref:DMT family transporter n=1 Tax=Mesorhizobium sp. SB112 TaxID=3151853 RepID=UPI0032656B3E